MTEALPNSFVEAMSEKERDQIETILGDAEHLAKIIKSYLKVVDYCNEHKMPLPNRRSLYDIRHRKEGGPLADSIKTTGALSSIFETGMTDMTKNISVEHKDSLEKRLER